MVTHGLHWLPQCDNVVVLVGGDISEYGTYDDLLNENGALAQFIKQYLITSAEEEEEDEVDPDGKYNNMYINQPQPTFNCITSDLNKTRNIIFPEANR